MPQLQKLSKIKLLLLLPTIYIQLSMHIRFVYLRMAILNAVGTHQELIDTCLEYQKLWTMANNSANWRVSHNQGGN